MLRGLESINGIFIEGNPLMYRLLGRVLNLPGLKLGRLLLSVEDVRT